MRWAKTVTLTEAHAEGEIGRVVTGGVIDLPGATMLDKLRYLNETDDSLRRFLVFEPRGFAQMSTNLIFAPTRPDADVGFLVLQGDRAHAMSGSNCICLVTVLLETGMLPMTEPETIVRLDSAAGLVVARATCRNGKCERVSLDMPLSFAHALDLTVEVPELGPVTLDIAFGGVFYALIDPAQFGLTIAPEAAKRLIDIGLKTHRAIKTGMEIRHPESDALNGLAYTMFVSKDAKGDLKGATVLPPGRFDRSPCGTGNSARAAAAAAKGLAQVGDRFDARSIIDSHFQVEIIERGTVAGLPAIRPRITGRAWIYGVHQLGLDPSDPYPLGFKVADCWGDAFDLLS